MPGDFNFIAGQYIWLMIPELKYPDIKGNTRMFSVASSPNHKGELDLIFRTSESGYKKTLIEMQPGAKIIFSGPFGSLELPESNFLPVVFVAGGVGVAPFLSMILFSDETHSGHRMTLVYVNAESGEAAYLDELTKIKSKNQNFELIPIPGSVLGSILSNIILQLPSAVWYVIGPKGFVDYAGKFLIRHGIPSKSISFEQFYPD